MGVVRHIKSRDYKKVDIMIGDINQKITEMDTKINEVDTMINELEITNEDINDIINMIEGV